MNWSSQASAAQIETAPYNSVDSHFIATLLGMYMNKLDAVHASRNVYCNVQFWVYMYILISYI